MQAQVETARPEHPSLCRCHKNATVWLSLKHLKNVPILDAFEKLEHIII